MNYMPKLRVTVSYGLFGMTSLGCEHCIMFPYYIKLYRLATNQLCCGEYILQKIVCDGVFWPCIPLIWASVVFVCWLEINLSLREAHKHNLLIHLPFQLKHTHIHGHLYCHLNTVQTNRSCVQSYLVVIIQGLKILFSYQVLHMINFKVT